MKRLVPFFLVLLLAAPAAAQEGAGEVQPTEPAEPAPAPAPQQAADEPEEEQQPAAQPADPAPEVQPETREAARPVLRQAPQPAAPAEAEPAQADPAQAEPAEAVDEAAADEALDTALDQGLADDDLFGGEEPEEDWGPDGVWGTEDDPPLEGAAAEPEAAEPEADEAHAAGEDAEGDEAHGADAEGEHAEGEHTAGAEHAEHEGEHEPAHFDAKVFGMQALNFLVWLAIIVVLLRKPLAEYLKNRRLAVEEGLVEAKRLEREATEKYDEYSERLERLDEELEKLRGEMLQAGESERDRIIAEAEARAARMRKDAQFIIDQQVKQLRGDLTREAIEAAVAAAEKVLVEQTGASDQQKLADAYLERLEEEVRA